MTNYYSQQPAFDRADKVTVSFFENVLYPRNTLGFTILMWALVAHFAIMCTLIALFVTNTEFMLLGNAWSAFAQIAESQAVMEYALGARAKTDAEVLSATKNSDHDNLRARLVQTEEEARIAIE
jgi:hypothetical protein